MAIPDFQTLMLPVLRSAQAEEVKISNVVELLASEFRLTEEERAQLLPSGRQTTFANRVHWAKSYLAKAGLVQLTRRAHFVVTPRGSEVLSAPPEKIDITFLSQYPEFVAFREASSETETSDAASLGTGEAGLRLTPDEAMRAAATELETALADELLQRVLNVTPAFFESVVVRLLIAMGYGGSLKELDKALVGKSGDGGVDGIISQDALGLDRIYVQAKRYQPENAIGAAAIRDFFGSLDRFKATKGLFVTTSSFSSGARETAEMLSKRIVLLDGQQLARLMIRHDVGCRTEETLTIKKVDEDFFDA
jgi:restriction system protein